ncbi:LPXTG cell wall anchor domain-containing protein [Streptococcus iniae]
MPHTGEESASIATALGAGLVFAGLFGRKKKKEKILSTHSVNRFPNQPQNY